MMNLHYETIEGVHSDLANAALLRRKTVELLTGLGKTTIYKLIKQNDFPAPCKIGSSRSAARWRAHQVLEWINAQAV